MNTTSGPVSISVVREDGRWFVSPVTTVLGVVDHDDPAHRSAHRSTRCSVSRTSCRPTARSRSTSRSTSRVERALAQQQRVRVRRPAGQKIVGEIAGRASGDTERYLVRVRTALHDRRRRGRLGRLPGHSDRAPTREYFYTNSVELPKTGSYRLVIDPYPTHGIARRHPVGPRPCARRRCGTRRRAVATPVGAARRRPGLVRIVGERAPIEIRPVDTDDGRCRRLDVEFGARVERSRRLEPDRDVERASDADDRVRDDDARNRRLDSVTSTRVGAWPTRSCWWAARCSSRRRSPIG